MKDQSVILRPLDDIWDGEFIKLKRSAKAAFIILDRAGKANAYNRQMLEEMERALESIEDSSCYSAAVFKSSSKKYFCAGADLKELNERGADEILELKSRKVFEHIRGMSSVTVAAISGDTVGGGLELALACDIRVASPDSWFWLPETKLGLLPAAGGLEMLPATVGISTASDMVLSGRKLSSSEALQCGLVSRILDGNIFHEAVAQFCLEICKQDRIANKVAKHILNNSIGMNNGHLLHSTAQGFLTLLKRSESNRS